MQVLAHVAKIFFYACSYISVHHMDPMTPVDTATGERILV